MLCLDFFLIYGSFSMFLTIVCLLRNNKEKSGHLSVENWLLVKPFAQVYGKVCLL